MPTINTFAAASVNGFQSSGIGTPYWGLNISGDAAAPNNMLDVVGSAVDAQGNVYTLISNYGATAAVLVKTNSASTVVWQKSYTLSGFGIYPPVFSGSTNIAIDYLGNVFFSGQYGADTFTFKVDPSGAVLWVQGFYDGTNLTYDVTSINVDSSGNLYVYAGKNNNNYSYLIKYNGSTGGILWKKQFVGTGSWDGASPRSVFVSPSGDVFIAALLYNGGIGGYGYVAKFNSSGTYQWGKRFAQVLRCMTVDSNGNVYVQTNGGGSYNTTKYDSSGTFVSCFGVSNVGTTPDLIGLFCDSYNNVYSVGVYSYGTPFTTVIKRNSSGTQIGAYKIESSSTFAQQYVYGTTDANDNVYVSIHMQRQIAPSYVSQYHPVVFKLKNNGSITGAYFLNDSLDGTTFTFSSASYTESSTAPTEGADPFTISSAAGTTISPTSVVTTTTFPTYSVVL